ncbi:staygreen family protein [Bacillus sp. S/N-304-OC-R1]|uniref:staygreen family protein n=1 Tax=Bacillus sp. S/N-304-OC-R1 TaxID=2758034 RepID=UPI001C8E24AC|nr:staygreen family protein [Bacillus sp. S/N-304-OC-R1]MBY0120479.1 staygreen family protein [Bacillus sp. S/N-304-OC-R1]
MNKLDVDQLSVSYLPPTTEFRPVDGRKYTLLQSNTSGEWFLTIGYHYHSNDANRKFRDEVFAEWVPQMGQYVLSGKVFVSDQEFDKQYAKIRFMIFQREVEQALSAIVYGDRVFYSNYPWLLDSPIYIHFDSNYEDFNKMIYYGTPRQYLNAVIQPIET